MVSTAVKISKNSIAPPQKAGTSFFRKAGEHSFFNTQTTSPFFTHKVQLKLAISKPGDAAEVEADTVAEKVMRMPGSVIPKVARTVAAGVPLKERAAEQPLYGITTSQPGEQPLERKEQVTAGQGQTPLSSPGIMLESSAESEDKLRLKRLQIFRQPANSEPIGRNQACRAVAISQTNAPLDRLPLSTVGGTIQCSGRAPPAATTSFGQGLAATKGSGEPLPGETRRFMEGRLNANFGNVRVHANANAASMTSQLQAKAFAHGRDIYFNSGQYNPGTTAGKTLLAHELTHTIQQGASPAHLVARDNLQPNGIRGPSNAAISTSPKQPHQEGWGNIIQTSPLILQSGGSSLSAEAKEYFGDQFKTDVSDIRVHADFESALLCRSRNVPAFANGIHLVFDPSRYSPDSATGGTLLAKQIAASLKQRSIHVPGLDEQLNEGIRAVQHGQGRTAPAKTPPDPKNLLTARDKRKLAAAPRNGSKQKARTTKQKRKTKKQPAAFAGKLPKPNPEKSPSSPEEDPAFFRVVKKINERSLGQQQHDDPAEKAKHAREAATAVPDEAQGAAKERKTTGMEEVAKQDKPFDDESFKADLLSKIEEVTPKNLEEATEFKENNKIPTVKSAMGQKLGAEKEKTAGPVQQVTQQPLQVNEADNKKPIPLPPTLKGNQPSPAGAQAAAPKPKLDSEISMDAQSHSLDAEMQENNVSEAQLAKSNEPGFTKALEEKKSAQKDAREKPAVFRKNESAELKAAGTANAADASKSMTTMFSTRGKNFEQVVKQQQSTKSKDEQERAAVVTKIQGMYQQTETLVTTLLNAAELTANSVFDAGSEKARVDFENYVDGQMNAYKRKRYSGFWGGLRWARDKLFGMPPAVNKFYTEGRQRYLDQMNLVITQVAKLVTTNLNAAKQAIIRGKQQIAGYVSGLKGSLKKVGSEAAESIQDKFESLEQTVNDKREQLVDGLARKYVANAKKLDDRITELKEANKGLVAKAIGLLKAVWKVIKNLYSLFQTILSRIKSIIGLIIEDPGKFFDNLGSAFKQGFERFQNRIGEHLENGLMTWLATQLGIANIKLPDRFDISEIFGLVLNVLDVTYGNIKERAVNLIGEERVALLEQTTAAGADIFQRIKQGGLAAIWDMLSEKLSDFRDMIWESIKSLIKSAVVKAAITFMLSLLNPVAAFVKACMAIYQFIMMLVKMKDRIIDLLNSILDAVAMIAGGSVDKAAAAIEMAFAKSIPIIIGFLAALLGLNDIGSRVKSIMLRIREKVNRALDWALTKSYNIARPAIEAALRIQNKGKALYEKGKEKGRALVERGKEKARSAVGGGGTVDERLEHGLTDAQAAVNRYAGRRVGALVLKPLLGVIKLRYGFQSLDVVADGTHWAVEGRVNPGGRKKTEALKDQVADATAPPLKTGDIVRVITPSSPDKPKSLAIVLSVDDSSFKCETLKLKVQRQAIFRFDQVDTKWVKTSEKALGMPAENLLLYNKNDYWEKEDIARQVLNYRYRNNQYNEGGKEWEHIVEQSQKRLPWLHSVENLVLTTVDHNRAFNEFFSAPHNAVPGKNLRATGDGVSVREYLRKVDDPTVHIRWKQVIYERRGLSIREENKGRGRYKVLS